MPGSKPPRRKGRKGPTQPRSRGGSAVPPEFAKLLGGMSPQEVQLFLGQMLAVPSPFGHAPAVPSRRRVPRDEVTTYRIRVDLQDAKPPIWRRLEVASDLTLDRVHHILQTAIGWTDSHLHEFASGATATDRLAEHYRPTNSIDEGLAGVDETSVRLDEVLVDPGDRLFYLYDFGDDWMHTLRLEAVEPREPERPAALVIGGARACPPEDCGGVWRYRDLLHVVHDPGPDDGELLAWIGPDFDPERFDMDAVNAALAHADRAAELDDLVRSSVDPASPIGAVLRRMPEVPDELAAAVQVALRAVPDPDVSTKAALLGPYLGLLQSIGDQGVALTQAGYLPPAMVHAVSEMLRLDQIWIGKNNRESLTYPVLQFRESAQRLGLLRKSHNTLTLTQAGKRARSDVGALWRHLAGALPLSLPTRGPEARASVDAGALVLLGVAAGMTRLERSELVAECLDLLGWRQGPLSPLSARDVRDLSEPTQAVLETIGVVPIEAFRDLPDAPAPTPAGAAFARLALDL